MFQLLLVIIYISFISLGLPDSLLGSAWPSIYREWNVPISYAGIISMIIAFGTIISSLQSDRLTRKLGTGKVTAISVGMTAAALFGFSVSTSFWMLCLWAVPYGLGAGSVDASLNNYVALHYKSHHMSWLHCMWGLGATAGPYIMNFALTGGMGWTGGYRIISFLQVFLTLLLVFTLPLWKGRPTLTDENGREIQSGSLSLKEIIQIPGAKEVMICFFCYCATRYLRVLWASSYLHLYRGISSETAARFAGLFFIGITAGRALSGFITMKLNDVQMIRMGAVSHRAWSTYYDPSLWTNRFPCRTDRHRAWMRAGLSLHHPLHPGAFRSRTVPGCDRRPDGQRLPGNFADAAVFRADRQSYQRFTVSVLYAGDPYIHDRYA